MSSTAQSTITESISRQIRKSRKPLTVLITDIEGSTRYFDRNGDIQGRLMVDRHNRLVFPVIKSFRGKVFKTTGDGVIAAFSRPGNAVKAAIGIQQILKEQREQDKKFCQKVRIGIHTGKAIVEDNDIFGDAVNVTARVENQGKGDEILVAGSTATKLKKTEFGLVRKGRFTPKGKDKPLTVYQCRWKDYPSLIGDIRFSTFLPVITRQKIALAFHSIVSIGILYFLYLKYLRFVIADSESLALLTLNPQLFFKAHPIALIALIAAGAGAVFMLRKIKTIPHSVLGLMKGGFWFSLAFLTFYLPMTYLPIDMDSKWNQKIFQSHHLFVQVLEDNTAIRHKPTVGVGSRVLDTVDLGTLLLLADVVVQGQLTWNKVLIGEQQYGWIPRVIPPKMGKSEKRVTFAQKFYFRYSDLYALLAGIAGLMWGFVTFRIRPA